MPFIIRFHFGHIDRMPRCPETGRLMCVCAHCNETPDPADSSAGSPRGGHVGPLYPDSLCAGEYLNHSSKIGV